jgi:uncharacterized membrane protein
MAGWANPLYIALFGLNSAISKIGPQRDRPRSVSGRNQQRRAIGMPIGPAPTTRLEAFTDAVIAIALTIMVLELRPADVLGEADVAGALSTFGPKLLIYVLSFVVILRIWINHHRLLEIARHTTTAVFWLNGLLLFWLSLIPFATALVGIDPGRPLASAIYGTVFAMTTAAFSLLRYYILSRLARPGAEHVVPRTFVSLSAVAIVPYAAAALLAFVSTRAALLIFALMPAALFAMDVIFQPRHDRP